MPKKTATDKPPKKAESTTLDDKKADALDIIDEPKDKSKSKNLPEEGSVFGHLGKDGARAIEEVEETEDPDKHVEEVDGESIIRLYPKDIRNPLPGVD